MREESKKITIARRYVAHVQVHSEAEILLLFK